MTPKTKVDHLFDFLLKEENETAWRFALHNYNPEHIKRMITDVLLHSEVPICAAVKLKDGRVINGHRHRDCIRNIAERPDALNLLPVTHDMQGFTTSNNRFVSKKEAYQLMVKAGKKSHDKNGYRGKILCSEDLY